MKNMATEFKTASIWNRLLHETISLPVVHVERADFLRKELSKICSPEQVEKAIEEGTNTVLTKNEIDKLSRQCINYHLTMVCSTSALFGLPGGWWMAGTIPSDLTQFYGHILSLTQKLIYLYGWPSLTNAKNELDDGSLNILTLFVGVMMGNKLAADAIKNLLRQASTGIGVKLSETAAAKYVISVASKIGLDLTQKTFAQGVGKIVPIVGMPISAAITYYTFKPMANRLKKHLDELYQMAEEKKNPTT